MIVLRSWTDQSAFVVVVILIPQIPIEPPVDLDRQTSFRGLKAIRIRRDQCSRRAGWIREAIALSRVLVDSIGRVKRDPWMKSRNGIHKEEMVSREIQAVAQRVTHTIEKVFQHGVAGDPVVVVASTE